MLLQARNAASTIEIGDSNHLSNNVTVIALERIKIGNNCLIGDSVAIYDSDFHPVAALQRKNGNGLIASVIIQDNVWIGSRSIILKGVTIGSNSVIGAMSLVTKSVPPNSIYGGVPAKLLSKLPTSEVESAEATLL